MIFEEWLEIWGERRPHNLFLEYEFDPGRQPPRVSDHDAPGFADPGDGGYALIRRAWIARAPIVPGHERLRLLSDKLTRRLKEIPEIEDKLFEATFNRRGSPA